jgi:serine/threonine protein kinase
MAIPKRKDINYDAVLKNIKKEQQLRAANPVKVKLEEVKLRNAAPIVVNPRQQLEKRRSDALQNELSYLKDYKISVGSESLLTRLDIISKLGEGGFGEVFKVKTKNRDAKMALKKTKLTGNKDHDLRTLREVKNNQELKHDNIVNFYKYWIEFDSRNKLWLYLFMELCAGSLSDWFKKNPIRSREINVRMFMDILKGIKYIHAKKFIHRDLKPANILVSLNGKCKIADFGLSTLHTTRFETMANYYHSFGMGTPIYAAPEQLQGKRYNFKVDIFPLGCIWMEFLADFKSDNSLILAIINLRENHVLPFKFQTTLINEGKLIHEMTRENADKRPTIDEVIKRVK